MNEAKLIGALVLALAFAGIVAWALWERGERLACNVALVAAVDQARILEAALERQGKSIEGLGKQTAATSRGPGACSTRSSSSTARRARRSRASSSRSPRRRRRMRAAKASKGCADYAQRMAGGAGEMRPSYLLLLEAALVAASASLAACTSAVKVPDEIPVAVGVSCVDQERRPKLPPAATARPEAEIKQLDDYKVIPRLRADRLELIEYVGAGRGDRRGLQPGPACAQARQAPRPRRLRAARLAATTSAALRAPGASGSPDPALEAQPGAGPRGAA
jgi:hypothetical protein